jgi:hypothetical protein
MQAAAQQCADVTNQPHTLAKAVANPLRTLADEPASRLSRAKNRRHDAGSAPPQRPAHGAKPANEVANPLNESAAPLAPGQDAFPPPVPEVFRLFLHGAADLADPVIELPEARGCAVAQRAQPPVSGSEKRIHMPATPTNDGGNPRSLKHTLKKRADQTAYPIDEPANFTTESLRRLPPRTDHRWTPSSDIWSL